MAIRVQREDFDVGAEITALTEGNPSIGGVTSFVGLVRDMADGERTSAMTLEHYPGMTEKMLAEIDDEIQGFNKFTDLTIAQDINEQVKFHLVVHFFFGKT